MDDASIIDLLIDRDDRAISEIDLKYGRLLFKLADNILDNSADAEECVNDAYYAVWNHIPPDLPTNFCAYLCRITKNNALKKADYYSAKKRSKAVTESFEELSEILSGKSTPEVETDFKELGEKISIFLRSQKQRERNIFIKRYWYYSSLADIAEEFGIRERNVSVILHRQRKKLKDFLKKEGYEL
ncbi:MAG: sigma-70 family RNA polymerase sigma factor [Clostridia bacterium]|nr:sigma-70 family RNA polymerase sigma factor [Clostridia bacterium]